MRTVKELLLQWFDQVSRRRAIAATRLLIGIEHAKVNNNVLVLEDELLHRFGGTSHLLPNGQVVVIGKDHSCAPNDRMRLHGTAEDSPTAISALPSWSYCEARADAGTATPIERFIYDNEPADGQSGGQEWRRQLLDALNYAHTHVL